MTGIYIDAPELGHNTALTQDVLYGLDGRDQLLSSEATLYAEGGRGNDFIGIINNPNGVVVSAEYQPVQNWNSGPFTATGSSCKASVHLFPDVWTPLKGGTMTYAVG